MDSRRNRPTEGFTLIEMMISLAILGILLVSVFSITIETYAYIADTEVDYSTQAEANQALDRMSEILRKCGWNSAGGLNYPRVTGGGTELQFRVLRDLDGNGFPYSATTGELEWGPMVYTIRQDGGGNLRVFNNTGPVWHLARYVNSISFATYNENPALHLREVQVTLQTRKMTKGGAPIDFSLVGTVDMRN